MLTAGVGLSKRQDTELATREAVHTALTRAGSDTADIVVVFATAHHGAAYGRLLRTVQETHTRTILSAVVLAVCSRQTVKSSALLVWLF
jgi:hypothetical protein